MRSSAGELSVDDLRWQVLLALSPTARGVAALWWVGIHVNWLIDDADFSYFCRQLRFSGVALAVPRSEFDFKAHAACMRCRSWESLRTPLRVLYALWFFGLDARSVYLHDELYSVHVRLLARRGVDVNGKAPRVPSSFAVCRCSH